MTDIPLNTYIGWTDADRKRGKCPVPDGSDVTVWIAGGDTFRDVFPEERDWDLDNIIGYLVHELAREPIVAWTVADGNSPISQLFTDRQRAEAWAKSCGERVVKLVEDYTNLYAVGYDVGLEDGFKEAQVKLARAIKALEKIAQHDTQALALNTLAELKGGSDG